ncbi:TPA: hypothetical protein ACRZZI_004976 [Vibrio harveyi]
MTELMTKNDIGLEIAKIVEYFDLTENKAKALELLDALVMRLWSDDGTESSEELKQRIYYGSGD